MWLLQYVPVNSSSYHTEKANFPISKLNLLLYNFNEWPLLLSYAKVKKKLILIDTTNVI